jgi:predicted DNA-binding protein
MNNVEVKIRLPKYLADWLNEFSRELGRTPDDFIGEVLHRYYDAWKIGREAVTTVTNLRSLSMEFLQMRKNDKRKIIVNHFVKWAEERSLGIDDLNENAIKEFLAHYAYSRNIKKSSLDNYKGLLKKFIEFIKSKRS